VDQGPEDFAAFYEKHRDSCFRAILASVSDRHQAEELTAEAFARAWAAWRRVRDHPAPAAWVVRTALNTHISWWRRRRREVAWDAGAVGEHTADDDATLVGSVLVAALRRLPIRQREVVVLRVFLDLDTRATAASLGIAEGTVKSHLSRATAALREEFRTLEQEDAW
jgi:RNA polymerase sigma-70 factor (sigma-E family)